MHNRTHKFLLILVALALVVAPLRGALALPAPGAADVATHCEQMQGSTHTMVHTVEVQHTSPDTQDHECGGDCCKGTCNACAHGATALSNHTLSIMSDSHHTPQNIKATYSISSRITYPPFRPPIFRHS